MQKNVFSERLLPGTEQHYRDRMREVLSGQARGPAEGGYTKFASAEGFFAELSKIATEKDSGFLDTMKGALTRPIPGTPDLMTGAKDALSRITQGGAAGKGPSDAFKKFQQKRASGMPSFIGGKSLLGGGTLPRASQVTGLPAAAAKPAAAMPSFIGGKSLLGGAGGVPRAAGVTGRPPRAAAGAPPPATADQSGVRVRPRLQAPGQQGAA